MLFITDLTEAEKITLRDAHKYHPLTWTRIRAHCILLSNQRYNVKDIASMHGVCRQTIALYIHRWEKIGFLGLVDEHRDGRPKILSKEQEDAVIKYVMDSPRSLKNVLNKLSEKHQIRLSIATIKRLCKSAKMNWKRIRKSLKSKRNEKDFEQSKALINQLIAMYKNGEINLRYFDESGFSLVSNIPYAWQKKGEHIEIPSSRSVSYNVLGFMDRNSDLYSFVFTGSITTDVVTACFDEFTSKCNINKPTIVVVDNAPTHTSHKFDQKTIEWLEKGLVVVPLSKYSPELNIIEILWRKIKYEWMPFSAYNSLSSLESMLFSILKDVGTKFKIKFC